MSGSTKAFTIRNYYPRDIPIDDGVDGEGVQAGTTFPIRIRRFTVAQLQAFQRGFARAMSPTSERFLFRKPDSDEQVMRDVPERKDAKGRLVSPAREAHVVPDDEITRRRLAEMSPETRAAYEAAKDADDVFMATFCSEAIAAHVWLPPGVTVRIVDEDQAGHETEIIAKDGPGLVQAFGGNFSMLARLTRAIHQENTLSPEAKKAWRLLSGSTASLSTPAAAGAVDGATPAATATSAGAAASASSADASADPDRIPSGWTGT